MPNATGRAAPMKRVGIIHTATIAGSRPSHGSRELFSLHSYSHLPFLWSEFGIWNFKLLTLDK